MNHTSDTFSAPRFLAYLRLLWQAKGKQMLAVAFALLTILCIFFFVICGNDLDFLATNPHFIGEKCLSGGYDIIHDHCVASITFMLIIYSLYAIWVSLKDVRSKEKRMRFLTLPVSRFEKYAGSLAILLFAGVLFLAACAIADGIRIVVYEQIYPTLPYFRSLIMPLGRDLSESDTLLFLAILLCNLTILRYALLCNPWKVIAAGIAYDAIMTGSLLLTVELFYEDGYYYPRMAFFIEFFRESSNIVLLLLAFTLFHEWMVFMRFGELKMSKKK